MRISETRYRRLFEAAHDGVLILDSISRKIIDANPFITDLLGYTRDELLDKELWEIGLIKDERSSRAVFRELQEKGEVRYEDLPLQSKSGVRREVEVVANRYDEDGKQVVQCNIRDITERKRIEEALRKSEARSRELSQTAEVARVSAQEACARAEAATRAKDDFLAALSHELRTPLTPALLLASCWRKGIVLSVTDDGVGFQNELNNTSGLGLSIMKYRARSIGGRLEIESRKKGGTRVACYLPHSALQSNR